RDGRRRHRAVRARPPRRQARGQRRGGAVVTRAFVLVALAGCFSPTPPSGKLLCSASGECPSGYHCVNDRCWKNGEGPEMSVELDGGEDLAVADASLDLAMPRDATTDATFDGATSPDAFVLGTSWK